ncbi:TPA: diguanylate cyclase, partial [Candidatus Micrarchaeota archaeon]|nr:diguanylate cyclase [Candidatus Micrarchaeota archaeon]
MVRTPNSGCRCWARLPPAPGTAASGRHGHLGALLFLDLDHFKTVNDSLGHPVGDRLLQEVAARLLDSLREEDTAARLSGDEFVILLPQLTGDPTTAADQAHQVAKKIQEVISQPIRIEEQVLDMTLSIGVALFPKGTMTSDDILKQADTALYRAKEAGRNMIRFFLPSMQIATEARLHMQSDLRRAIKHQDFFLNFQPQVDVHRGIIGAEALLRWKNKDSVYISPEKFIPVAEECGL